MNEGRAWLTRLLSAAEDQTSAGARDAQPPRRSIRAKALLGAGVLARRHGDYASSRALLEEALAPYAALGDASGRATRSRTWA